MTDWIPLRQSRLLPAAPGIYMIRHTVSHMAYIGLSKNIRERAASHRSARAWHYFGRALRAHGLDMFDVRVLVLGEIEDLGRLEQEMIKVYRTLAPGGYNLSAGGDGPTGVLWSDERKAAQSTRVAGKSLTAEARQKMSAAALASNPFKGRTHSAETKAKMVAAAVALHTGRKRTDETKARISASLVGRAAPVLSAEARERVRAGRLGKKFPGTGAGGERNGMYGIKGAAHPTAKRLAVWQSEGFLPLALFETATEAAAWAGVKVASISDWCVGRYRAPNGWLWAYI